MAQNCGFFNAHLVGEEYDRVYLAETFAKYFASFIGNGVFGGKSTELQVRQANSTSMSVQVLPGQGFINGYWYENDSPLTLNLSVADGVLNRIDTIVLRWGLTERDMWIDVKRGNPGVIAYAPEVQRDSDYFELQLAKISVPAGTTSILPQNIIDTRLDTKVCGIVHGVIEQLDTSQLGYQLNSFIEQYMRKSENSYQRYLESLEELKTLASNAYQAYLDYLEGLKSQGRVALESYLVWLNGVKESSLGEIQSLVDELEGLIGSELAGELLLRIKSLEERIPDLLVAEIDHNHNSYVHCDVYELEYGAGVGPAGEGPAGGSALISTPYEYSLDGLNRILIKTKSTYGEIESMNQLSNTIYLVLFKDSIKSLLVLLRP